MADLRVISGDKGTEREADHIDAQNIESAAYMYLKFLRQAARSLAGPRNVVDVSNSVGEFLDFIKANKVRYLEAMEKGALNAQEELRERIGQHPKGSQLAFILESSLLVYAECLDDDGFSKARLSKRITDLCSRIEHFADGNGRRR